MNKFLLHITSLVALVLFLTMGACNNTPKTPILLEAEKTIEKQPDSALNYLGRVNSDLQDALQAQEYYLKALEIGEDSKDYTLLINTYNNLGTLYAHQDINDMALPMYKKALSYLELEPDSVKTAFTLRNIARIYSLTQKPDSSIIYYKRAISYSAIKNRASILTDLGNLYLSLKDYKKAYQCIEKAKPLIGNEKTLYSLYLSKGELHIATNQLDSAKFYLNHCVKSSNIHTRAGSLYHLAQIAQKEKNINDLIKYSNLYEQTRNSIVDSLHFENTRLTQSMFNYQRIVNEKNKYEKVFERYDFPYEGDYLREIFDSVSPDITVFMGAFDSNYRWQEEGREAVRFASNLMNMLVACSEIKKGRVIRRLQQRRIKPLHQQIRQVLLTLRPQISQIQMDLHQTRLFLQTDPEVVLLAHLHQVAIRSKLQNQSLLLHRSQNLNLPLNQQRLRNKPS